MTLEECYAAMGGDYADVIGRLRSEAFIKKFVLKFADSTDWLQLHAALEENRIEDAFRAAHTMKGVASNLGMTELYSASSQLTELLRDGVPRDVSAALAAVDASYQKTLAAIQRLRADKSMPSPVPAHQSSLSLQL